MPTGIAGMRDMRHLPTLEVLIAKCSPPMPHHGLVLITHVLPTAVPFVRALSTLYTVRIVAVPYSADANAVAELQSAGFEVIVPRDLNGVATAALELVNTFSRQGIRTIVQEVGGYLARHVDALAGISGFCGIVEDTNQGHWRYEEVAAGLRFPVLSIARAPIKDIEDTLIGDAALYSIERILRERLHRVVQGTNSLVLGFGKIGTSCAIALRGRESAVAVFDTDPTKVMRARAEGFRVGPLDELLRHADIVVGASGHRSLEQSHFPLLKPGAVLASASSRQIEFDVDGLRNNYDVDAVGDCYQTCRRGSHHFFLLMDGFPVNFRDNSILGDTLDAIYSQLFVCIREIASGTQASGLLLSTDALAHEVAASWCRIHLGWPFLSARN